MMFDLLKKSAVQITMLFVEKKSSKTMILSKLHKYAVFMRINLYRHIKYYAEAALLKTWKFAAHNQNMIFFFHELYFFFFYMRLYDYANNATGSIILFCSLRLFLGI